MEDAICDSLGEETKMVPEQQFQKFPSEEDLAQFRKRIEELEEKKVGFPSPLSTRTLSLDGPLFNRKVVKPSSSQFVRRSFMCGKNLKLSLRSPLSYLFQRGTSKILSFLMVT